MTAENERQPWQAPRNVRLPICGVCNKTIYPKEYVELYNRTLDSIDIKHTSCVVRP